MTGYDCLVSPGLIYTPCEGCKDCEEYRGKKMIIMGPSLVQPQPSIKSLGSVKIAS